MIPRIRDSDDFLALIHALDEICAADRNSFLDASAAIFEGSVFVHSGWSHDQLDERDLTHTLTCYELVQVVAKKWERRDLMIDLACARSVIVDEGLSNTDEAIEIVDVAIEEYGRDPALIRQKSKVLGHYGREMEAADLLISIEDEVSLDSPFDRALALRDGGTSAARADRFADSARLFEMAYDALSGVEAYRALAAGLLADKALALWSSGDRASALHPYQEQDADPREAVSRGNRRRRRDRRSRKAAYRRARDPPGCQQGCDSEASREP